MTERLTYKQHAANKSRNADAYVEVFLDGERLGQIIGPSDGRFFVRLLGNAKFFEAFGKMFPSQDAAKAHIAEHLRFIDATKGL